MDNYDSYKELRDKYERSIQENARLQLNVQDIMERNLALQKALANVEKEVPQVNYVEYDEGRYYGGNVFIAKNDCLLLDATENPKDFLNHLLIILFGKEVLRKSSVKGEKSNRYKDKDGKPPLDRVKLQLIYSLMAIKSNNDKEYNNSAINKIISRKINNLLAAGKKSK